MNPEEEHASGSDSKLKKRSHLAMKSQYGDEESPFNSKFTVLKFNNYQVKNFHS